MAAHVRGENAHKGPAVVQFLGALADKPAHVVAPVREAAGSKGQPAPQGAKHAHVVVLAVPAPVERIPLTAGPSGTAPDHRLSSGLLGGFKNRLVIAQGIQIVLGEPRLSGSVYTLQGRRLAKVRLDGGNPQLEQAAQLFLIPLHGLGIGEIQHGVVGGQVSVPAFHGQLSTSSWNSSFFGVK